MTLSKAKRRKKAYNRQYRLLRTYGLTQDQYDTLLRFQGGVCAICRGFRRYQLAVDHDHKTGQVRGLLCKLCNGRLLTSVRDDVEALRRAVAYLEAPPAVEVLGVHLVPEPE